MWYHEAGGSVRQPAASQSVFGLRPSRGVLALEGSLVIHRYVLLNRIITKDALFFVQRHLIWYFNI